MSVPDHPDPTQRDTTQPALTRTPKLCPKCGARYESNVTFCPDDGSTLAVPGGTDLEGQVVAGRYRVIEQLGQGGMGRVYLAEHVKMGRRCAVKVMSHDLMSDADAISRFNREATNASRIQHPNVAAVYDFGESSDGLVYLAMELVAGEPLSAVCTRERVLPPTRAAEITRQVAEGLDAAHELGIVHRDLKPDNIMIGRAKDGRDMVKIVDFGIAKGTQQTTTERQHLTRTGFIVGTPQYMSPEQLGGDTVDGRSDLYSLGCILYEMLTGESSFAGPNIEVRLQRRLAGEPLRPRDTNPAVPVWLDALVVKALARDPEGRFQTAAEFRDALVAGLAAPPQPQPAQHAETSRSGQHAARRYSVSRRLWFSAGALAGVATLVTLGMNWRHPGAGGQQPVSSRATAPAGAPVPAAPVLRPAAADSTVADSGTAASDSSHRAAAPARSATTGTHPSVPSAPPNAAAARHTADSLAATTQLALMNAQRQALLARQLAVDSGSAMEDVGRGDQLMKTADSAIARRRYDAAVEAMQGAERTWRAAAQTATANRRRNPPASVAARGAPPSSTTSVPVTPPPTSAPDAANAAPVDPLPGIQAAITRYARALESRDIAQLRAAYPALTADQARQWQDIFDATNKLAATLTAVRPAHVTTLGTAEVDVTATFDFDFKRGMDGDRHPTMSYHALLTRDGPQWTLTSIK